MNHQRNNTIPRRVFRNVILMTLVLVGIIYGALVYANHKHPALTRWVRHPMSTPDAWVSVSLLVAVWLISLHRTTQGSVRTFWYETSVVLVLLVIVFLVVRTAIVLNSNGFNPATAWWSHLIAPPVGPALLVAVANALLVTTVFKFSLQVLTKKKQRIRYTIKPLLLKLQVSVLVLTVVGILVAVTA